MARLSLIALLALALTGVAQGNPSSQQQLSDGRVHIFEGWEYAVCGSENDIVEIKSINISPDPPKPGQNLTVNVVAYAHEVVEEGAYVDVTVKLGLIKLLHKQFDVCEEARKSDVDIQCPVEKGPYNVSQTVALPKEIPPAKFVVEIQGYTVNDEDLVCVNLKVDFMRKMSLNLW
ncbi:hypothetical protein PILCRDRAFT_817296 [Piloderma croceum F 1598]|uniref:Phosphatidylglycerol/phosphatidylinositol transfer protein n=1 Tax=Piloderma croceum (strain F 1598) TaxID=765440 RepID=A0A0C3C6L1_PILCF|nr:hypothetical protein PILCRDRAFT_817296 [Piloderma croceum F 1598]